jgi:hypothetical protein
MLDSLVKRRRLATRSEPAGYVKIWINLFLAWLSVDYVSPTNNKANGRLNYLTN